MGGFCPFEAILQSQTLKLIRKIDIFRRDRENELEYQINVSLYWRIVYLKYGQKNSRKRMAKIRKR